ncbi:MAG TPA: hypothetical protein VFA67_02635, partial [Candidatus Sulfotelmatobacter sp.]|nr:hypothetical protein [Candidatus Sulfotelmatobacter sp.]
MAKESRSAFESTRQDTRCLGFWVAVLTVIGLALPAMLSASNPTPISLYVDASDSARKLFHSELAIPVRPGPLT